MATVLKKDLVRESTVKRKDKEIMVTLGGNQELTLKLKGVRGDKGVTMKIGDLYDQLDDVEVGSSKNSQRYPDDLLIPIYELRSEILTSSRLTYEEKVKFSSSVRSVIDNTIKRLKESDK